MCDFGAVYKEEKCLVNPLNQVLNTATRRIVRQIEHKLAEENEVPYRVLKVTVEYVQDSRHSDILNPTRETPGVLLTCGGVASRHMIYMSHIKEVYTCESTKDLDRHDFIDPAPHAKATIHIPTRPVPYRRPRGPL